jgi:hypothetical protein
VVKSEQIQFKLDEKAQPKLWLKDLIEVNNSSVSNYLINHLDYIKFNANNVEICCFEKLDKPILIDLYNKKNLYRFKNGVFQKDLLAKAIGWKKNPINILDATLGFAQDTFCFLNMGIKVDACEQNSTIYAISRYLLETFPYDRWINSKISNIGTVYNKKVLDYLKETKKVYDVLYYDPMFSTTKKKSLPNLKMQLLQSLFVTNTEENLENELSELAKSKKANRIVVKRSINQFPLWKKPVFQVKGKSIRYDIYIVS